MMRTGVPRHQVVSWQNQTGVGEPSNPRSPSTDLTGLSRPARSSLYATRLLSATAATVAAASATAASTSHGASNSSLFTGTR
jgi:hypothetical protein